MGEGESTKKPFDENAAGDFIPLDLPAEIAGTETDSEKILERGREKAKHVHPDLLREVEEATKEAIRRNKKRKGA